MKKELMLRCANNFVLQNSVCLLGFLRLVKSHLTGRVGIIKARSFKGKRTNCTSTCVHLNNMEVTYLSQSLAQTIDNELMSDDVGYTTEQLMELAGLSIAQIICREYSFDKFKKILIFCGPGNNGGDGLVAARHLKQFGYDITVAYPKENTKVLFQRLLNLLHHYHVPVVKSATGEDIKMYDLVVDALFGFSFRGEPRSPFDEIIHMINQSNKPVVSVDVPSGINIDGDTAGTALSVNSEMNISLMLPKEGVRHYRKKHYLGGRFIPNSIVEKYNLKIPQFTGDNSYVQL
ncbi:pyridoxal 5'-phosphate synthase, putative [Plasmodium knowlesi strain H]|uniref:NAD(P)H-hydrate epimerase n=3 Tax=Plasmodium knowlesi TaxID=5850 RepID=NNRE_PLAKH|nr:pyridoxal 5'-phosphate synthase, putative [Plasmodium knowlesi strain H]B3L9G8.1 RecName: Full=NAD(P)H-hydrate epimerase; AltName: Full=NAD(P)HX epimerase [Plasmodium knowlesi strain H]OTN65300.1 NAD(P)H-hydrate epimerase [Plasmodium knowlesi]CAA9989549.1 pyridoxal 5'-phosphate synthase, putative [Plasmodium knowlesi strain H]VVS79023.1 pyridoxal 5'-phosphate synthase, putative [Plasmodium knowlesi strain H]|eukprot:XP_002260274.1 jeF-related protein, putative [Plasmodium knowlesi strain H]